MNGTTPPASHVSACGKFRIAIRTEPWGKEGFLVELEVTDKRPFYVKSHKILHFPSKEILFRSLVRLQRRAHEPSAGCALLDVRWPHRPFRRMRKNGRYLGALRGVRKDRSKKLLAFALVQQGSRELLEISDLEEDFIHAPVQLLAWWIEAMGK